MTVNNDNLGFNEDDSLPWLESAEEYDAYDNGDSGRTIGLVLIGLIALAAIIGAIYWFLSSGSGVSSSGDGSVIMAEKTPYKVRPKDPQGKEFEGTGDATFSASEGVPKQAKIGDSESAAKKAGAVKAKPPVQPKPKTAPLASAQPAPAPSAPSEADVPAPRPAAARGVVVQLGAYSTEALAVTGWNGLARKYDYIAGLPKTIVPADVDGGTVYRLSAIAPDTATANNVCNRLKASGGACYIRR